MLVQRYCGSLEIGYVSARMLNIHVMYRIWVELPAWVGYFLLRQIYKRKRVFDAKHKERKQYLNIYMNIKTFHVL